MTSILLPYVRTSHPYILLRTWEGSQIISDEAEKINIELAESTKDNKGGPIEKYMMVWDCLGGLRKYSKTLNEDEESVDPVIALGKLRDLVLDKNNPRNKHIVCFYIIQQGANYLESEQWLQAIDSTYDIFRNRGVTVVLVSPCMQISSSSPVAHKIKTLNVDLPNEARLASIIEQTCKSVDISSPKDKSLHSCINALKGLTEQESEDAIALSLSKHKKVEPNDLFKNKQQQIENTGALRILDPAEFTLENLCGLNTLKDYCISILSSKKSNKKAKPRGVLLLGVPGTGKTHFCRALGAEKDIQRPVIQLDLTAVRNKYVGESERILRDTLNILKSIGSCIVFVDEIEKQIQGGSNTEGSGHATDNGILALMLQFMDTASEFGIFFIATCNNIHGLPPEFKRSGRWNGTFFIDIPNKEQKIDIWNTWKQYYEIKDDTVPSDKGWCGSDIRTCCEQASLLDCDFETASRFVTPLILSDPESLNKLRNYASGRCVDADKGGQYQLNQSNLDSSNNEDTEPDIPNRARRELTL